MLLVNYLQCSTSANYVTLPEHEKNMISAQHFC